MRYACTVLLVLGLAASASAQRRGGGGGGHHDGGPPHASQQPVPPPPQLPWWSSFNAIVGHQPPPVGTPLPPVGTPQNALASSQPTIGSLPSIGLPLPSIGLGLPAIGLPPQNLGTQPMNPRAYRGHGRGQGGGLYYTVPPYGYPAAAYGVVTPPGSMYPSYPSYPTYPATPAVPEPPQPPAQPSAPESLAGGLRLDVEPSDLIQVFVDGSFIGTLRETGNEIALEPGTWRVELRAEGYKTLVFSAQIIPNRTITYRATLEKDPMVKAPPPVQLPVAPTGSRTIYVIPGCYLGNVSPQEIKLPPGCDLGKLRTIQ